MNHNKMLDIERRARELKIGGRHGEALLLHLELEAMYDEYGIDVARRLGSLNRIASLAVIVGRLGEADWAAAKCVGLYLSTSNRCDEMLATYIMVLSYVLAEKRNFESAISHGEEALALFIKTHGDQCDFVKYRIRDVERMRCGDTSPYLDR